MTKISQLLAVASLLSTAAAMPAHAADITYTGTQVVGLIDATYSITTNGNIGDLTGDDITKFDILLSDSGTIYDINSQNSSAYGFFSATQTNLLTNFYLGFTSNAETGISPNENFIFSNADTDAFILGNRNTISISNDISFATAVPPSTTSAVPEVTTWSMIIAGFAAVGFAMRRRQGVSTTVRFA